MIGEKKKMGTNDILKLSEIKKTGSMPLIPQIKDLFKTVYESDWVFVGWERWFVLGCFLFSVYSLIKIIF